MDILGKIESICDPDTSNGEWISKYDLVESGERLLVQEQDDFGECNSECRTIGRACNEIIGDHDTDVAEELYKVRPAYIRLIYSHVYWCRLVSLLSLCILYGRYCLHLYW